MFKATKTAWAILAVTIALWHPGAFAESQNNDYKGITDPFGDPANYEFSEDEKDDKEFFHLGRFFMMGVDAGAGLFTGGLGTSTDPGFYVGGHIIYFFDRGLAMEAAAHYASHVDSIRPSSGGNLDIDTRLIPITLGFRYYFDTRDTPRAIAIANPYLVLGAGLYIRQQSILSGTLVADSGDSTNNNFGAYGGGGVEFAVYSKHLYLGLDLRYHFIFFAEETFQNINPAPDRSGGYFTPCLSLTYNF